MIEVARLHRFENGSALKAFADVIIGQVLVKGVRVVSNKDGSMFVSMPQAQGKDKKWYDTVRVLDEEVKQELQSAVIEAYNS